MSGNLQAIDVSEKMSKYSYLLLIDADDTLWENAILFKRVKTSVAEMVIQYKNSESGLKDIDSVIAEINETEMSGKSIPGIANFRDAMVSVAQAHVAPDEFQRLKQHIDSLTHAMYKASYSPKLGVSETLRRLISWPHCKVLIVSSGRPYEQDHKFYASGLNSLFPDYKKCFKTIVKTVEGYNDLVKNLKEECQELKSILDSNIYIIGNSTKKEICPAMVSGYSSILIPNPNTWEMDEAPLCFSDRASESHSSVILLRSFAELCSVFSDKRCVKKLREVISYDSGSCKFDIRDDEGHVKSLSLEEFLSQTSHLYLMGDFVHEMLVVPETTGFESVGRYSLASKVGKSMPSPIQQYGGIIQTRNLLSAMWKSDSKSIDGLEVVTPSFVQNDEPFCWQKHSNDEKFDVSRNRHYKQIISRLEVMPLVPGSKRKTFRMHSMLKSMSVSFAGEQEYPDFSTQLAELTQVESSPHSSCLVIEHFSDNNGLTPENSQAFVSGLRSFCEKKNIQFFIVKTNSPFQFLVSCAELQVGMFLLCNADNFLSESGSAFYSWESIMEALVKQVVKVIKPIEIADNFSLMIVCRNEGFFLMTNFRKKNTTLEFDVFACMDAELMYDMLSGHSYGWIGGTQNLILARLIYGVLIEKQSSLEQLTKRAWQLSRAVFYLGYLDEKSFVEGDEPKRLVPTHQNIMNFLDEFNADFFENRFSGLGKFINQVKEYKFPVKCSNSTLTIDNGSSSEFFDLIEIYKDIDKTDWFRIAIKIVTNGPAVLKKPIELASEAKSGCFQLPLFNIQNLYAVGRECVENVYFLSTLIQDYINRNHIKRPLSIGVFGAPGSGKSFAVKQILKNISSIETEILEFNLSQMDDIETLMDAFLLIQDAGLKGALPVVFWDEFDCHMQNNPFGWLKYFLAPMQDGTYLKTGKNHNFGKAIFVFAGGICEKKSWFENLARQNDDGKSLDKKSPEKYETIFENIKLENLNPKQAKIPDFYSRLKANFDVPPLVPWPFSKNPGKDNIQDLLCLINRTIVFRSLIKVHAPQVHTLHAKLFFRFLRCRKFDTARKMESIIEASTLAHVKHYGLSALPLFAQCYRSCGQCEFNMFPCLGDNDNIYENEVDVL